MVEKVHRLSQLLSNPSLDIHLRKLDSSSYNNLDLSLTRLSMNLAASADLGGHLPRLQHYIRDRLYRRSLCLRVQYDGHGALHYQPEHPERVPTGHRLLQHVHRQPDLCQLDHDLGQEVLLPKGV